MVVLVSVRMRRVMLFMSMIVRAVVVLTVTVVTPVIMSVAMVVVAVGVRRVVRMVMTVFMIVAMRVRRCGLVPVIMTMVVSMIVAVPVIMVMLMRRCGFVRLIMAVLVLVVVIMSVSMRMIVTVAVIMIMIVVMLAMPLFEHRLRERIVFGECLVVTMFVTAAIRTRLRHKRGIGLFDSHAEPAQHIGEHRIVLDLEIAFADLDGRVPIAQMVGSARERKRGGARHTQHGFGSCDHADHGAIVSDQHIAVGENRAARQHDAHFFATVELRREAALAPLVKRQRQRGGTREQGLRDPGAGGNQSIECSHVDRSGFTQGAASPGSGPA